MEGHVFRIWEDLEVTMTKSGGLLNQRHEHMVECRSLHRPIPLGDMPCVMGAHGFLFTTGDKYQEQVTAIQAFLKANSL